MTKVEVPQGLQNEQWVRMPKPKGRLLGLSRTTLLELAERQEIKIAKHSKTGFGQGNSPDLNAQPLRIFGARYVQPKCA
jgi:hypothetical protein